MYKPEANGRADNAVRLVVDSLRKPLEQKCSRDLVRLLPLALWALNDIPGPLSGYSPHRILYGREPVGFGDVPPTIPKDGRAGAATFLLQLVKDGKMVKGRLADIYRKEAAKFLKHHPRQIFQEGENVWVRVNRQGSHRPSTKLDWVWRGPHEVQQRVRSGCCRLITKKGVEQVFPTVDRKPYIGPLDQDSAPLHYYTDVSYAVDSPEWVVEAILTHARRGTKKELHWLVRYQGYDKPEWQPASAFMHRITHAWVAYNRKHDLDIAVSDLRPDIWNVRAMHSYPRHTTVKSIADYLAIASK